MTYWLNYGEKEYGKTYEEAMEGTGYDYQTLKNFKWVADKIESCRRRQNLSFNHHLEVAALPAKEQDKWLEKAENGNWSRKDL